MRVVFADPLAHAMCADMVRASAAWGAGWTAIAFCLTLLINSADLADLRRWNAIHVSVAEGLIRVDHRGAVVTFAPLTDDGAVLALDEEDSMEHLDHIRQAQVVDVACTGMTAPGRRAR